MSGAPGVRLRGWQGGKSRYTYEIVALDGGAAVGRVLSGRSVLFETDEEPDGEAAADALAKWRQAHDELPP